MLSNGKFGLLVRNVVNIAKQDALMATFTNYSDMNEKSSNNWSIIGNAFLDSDVFSTSDNTTTLWMNWLMTTQ